jgi:hypothetical protein
MADDHIVTATVAANVAETDPIVLRESDSRRLLFKPMLIDQAEAPVRGYFVWQRKKKADDWEDVTGESLTSLKSGEGYSLALRSGEVAALIEGSRPGRSCTRNSASPPGSTTTSRERASPTWC